MRNAPHERDVRKSPEKQPADAAALPVIRDHDRNVMGRPNGAIASDADDATLIERDQRFSIAVVDVDEPFEQGVCRRLDRRQKAAVDRLARQPQEKQANEVGIGWLEEAKPYALPTDQSARHLGALIA